MKNVWMKSVWNEQKWIDWGKENLKPEVQELWEEVVPIRLNDLYEGMELVALKEIVEAYNDGKTREEIKEIFRNQGHSELSRGLMCALVCNFIDKELGEYLNKE